MVSMGLVVEGGAAIVASEAYAVSCLAAREHSPMCDASPATSAEVLLDHQYEHVPQQQQATLPPTPAPQPELRLVLSRPAIVALLSALLSSTAEARDAAARANPPPPYESLTTFHALESPGISIADYVARVAKYAYCSNAALISAYLYMQRVAARDPRLVVSGLSCHRLFITSVVLAAKFHDDVSYNLDYYGKVGGLPVPELAALEVAMLKTLDFRLSVSVEAFFVLEHRLLADLFALDLQLLKLQNVQQLPVSSGLVSAAVAECADAGLAPMVSNADAAANVACHANTLSMAVRQQESAMPAVLAGSQYVKQYAHQQVRHSALVRVASTASFLSAVTSEESSGSSSNSNCASPQSQSPPANSWERDYHGN